MITSEIGFNAGKVWEYLDENKEQPVKDLIKKLKTGQPTISIWPWDGCQGKVNYLIKSRMG